MPVYRLGSSQSVHAPGLIAWAINGYAFERDRATLHKVIVDSWPGVTESAAHQLLSGKASFTVDGDTVVFTANDDDGLPTAGAMS